MLDTPMLLKAQEKPYMENSLRIECSVDNTARSQMTQSNSGTWKRISQ